MKELKLIKHKLNNFIKISKKYLGSKKRNKIKSRILLNKVEQQSFTKKRQNINLRFDFLSMPKFIKKHYIPYFTIIFFILFLLSLFIFLGPIFKIKNIEIIKKENITNMEIAYKSLDKYRGDSIFGIDKNELLSQMRNYQHNIKQININTDFPNNLNITVESYKELFNINLKGKSYLLLNNGSIVPSKPKENIKNLEIIKEIDKNKFLSYKKIFNSNYINRINEIIIKLEENLINIKIEKLTYYETERELHIDIEKNTKLIFSLNKEAEVNEQIKKLAIFNKDHKEIALNEIIYIDLRVLNKIFFCDTDEEYKCRNNLKSTYQK